MAILGGLIKAAALLIVLLTPVLLTSCAKLTLSDLTENPQDSIVTTGDNHKYLFSAQARPSNTPISAVIENSISLELFINGNFEPMTGSGIGVWNNATVLSNAYCDGSINIRYRARYKTSTYFVGTRDHVRELENDIVVSRVDDVVIASPLFGTTAPPLRTQGTVPLLWVRNSLGVRRAAMVVVNWSEWPVEIVDVVKGDASPLISVGSVGNGNRLPINLPGCGDAAHITMTCAVDQVTNSELFLFVLRRSMAATTIPIRATCAPLPP